MANPPLQKHDACSGISWFKEPRDTGKGLIAKRKAVIGIDSKLDFVHKIREVFPGRCESIYKEWKCKYITGSCVL